MRKPAKKPAPKKSDGELIAAALNNVADAIRSLKPAEPTAASTEPAAEQ